MTKFMTNAIILMKLNRKMSESDISKLVNFIAGLHPN